ncbi:MAG: hypothetical protein PHT33_07210 [bacterium]|nr:hypothetical protein [bacterium]
MGILKPSIIALATLLIVTGGGVAAETDNMPAEQQQPPKGWHISDSNTSGRLDYQLMNMAATGADPMYETAGKLMAAEVETTATINNGERDVLDLALQWPYVTQMKGVDGRGKEMHFGNAYGIYKMGLGKPNIRFGQFVVPFGNLAYYETHTRPLQTLYPQSLGVRIDRGVSVEGFKGDYDYWMAAMGGNGVRNDNNGKPIAAGRIARRFDLANGGILTAGVSGLYGKDMPRFSTLVDPVMEEAIMDMPLDHSLTFTDKTRLGLDMEYSAGRDTWRAEVIGGRDSDGSVNGQFLQWNRALNEKNEITTQLARWEQPGGSRLRLGAAYGRKINDDTTIRIAAERSLGRIPGEDRNGTTVMLQFTREFSSLFGK